LIALISIVSFLVVIIVLVLVHELGHFITAKASKVKVLEFGLFFPPRLASIKRGDTIYSLNAIPLGGFVRLAGEEDPSVLGSLAGKNARTRILVLAAGSIMNVLLPIILFSAAYMVPHDTLVGNVVVEQVAPNSPAAAAGIQPGDAIVRIGGHSIENSADLTRYIQLNLGKEVTFLIKHPDSTTAAVTLTPRWKPPEGQGAVGIQVSTANATIVRQSYPFWRAIPSGVIDLTQTFVLFKNGIVSIIIGSAPATVTGPVGIAQLTGEVARAGISPLLEFAAFLSINLAIVNILPLPGLDGGRIAFVIVEKIRGKRVSPRLEALIHLIGFLVLIALILAVTYQDIVRIVSGGSLAG
jgi:regulator of sigma E protease